MSVFASSAETRRISRRALPSPVLAACLLALLPPLANCRGALAAEPAEARVEVRSQDELPRHQYRLPTATASALLDDDAAFATFADAVERDIRQVLATYAIDDPATLRRLYASLADIALVRGDAAGLRALAPKLRALSDKPSRRLMSGLDLEAHAAALDAPPGGRAAVYRAHYAAAIDPLPWDVVQDDVRMAWSGTSMAAPQVANLAAKLWAIEPRLSVAEVIALIVDGADPVEDGQRSLLHPKRSLERLAARGR